MGKLLAARTTQRLQVAEFVFNFNDYVTDSVTLVKETLGSTVALADPAAAVAGLTGPAAGTIVFDCIPLPPGAVIVGGAMIVETAVAGSTSYTVQLGVAGNLACYLAANSALAAGRTALLLTTPLASNTGLNVRATIAYTVANATAGRVRLRIDYTIDGKADEIVIV